MSLPQEIRRARAHARLDKVDAEIARWFVNDGVLSNPDTMLDRCRELREERLKVVAALEAAGGHDPHPTFIRPPTDAQRDANPACKACGAILTPEKP